MDQPYERKARTLKEYLESTKETIGVYRWIFSVVLTPQSRYWLIRMVVGMIFMNVLQTVQPGAISGIFNGLNAHSGEVILCGIGTFSLALLLNKIVQRDHDRAREWVMSLHLGTIDDFICRRFNEKSLAQHVEHAHLLAPTSIDKGKWRSIDIERKLYFEAIPTVLRLLLSIACLCFLNIESGVVMLLLLLIYVAWSMYLNSLVSRVCTPLDKKLRALGRRRNERMKLIERVKVCGKEEVETREMSEQFNSISVPEREFWLGCLDIHFLRSLVNMSCLIGVLAWGAWLAWKGKISIGMLYPLYTWATRVSDNAWSLGEVEHQINWNIPAVKSMIAALSIPPALVDKNDAVAIDSKKPHKIILECVSHQYRGKKEDGVASPALSCVSFTIERGEKVAVIGESGSGKSTLMKKVLRFDDPTSGRILVDGKDLRDIRQDSWKEGIGYIPQKVQVFDGTVKYNLTYGLTKEEKQSLTDEELWKLMRLLKIDFGPRLDKGLDTIVGENGIQLSGGQAQRLMIGAAVIKRPWLLVIDEATSSLDATTEKAVQEGLEIVLSENQTSALIVTHRLNTVRHVCTKFVVLKAADAVREGESQVEAIASSFEELNEMSPTFRQLALNQGVVMNQYA